MPFSKSIFSLQMYSGSVSGRYTLCYSVASAERRCGLNDEVNYLGRVGVAGVMLVLHPGVGKLLADGVVFILSLIHI